jgi:hypothetical protein
LTVSVSFYGFILAVTDAELEDRRYPGRLDVPPVDDEEFTFERSARGRVSIDLIFHFEDLLSGCPVMFLTCLNHISKLKVFSLTPFSISFSRLIPSNSYVLPTAFVELPSILGAHYRLKPIEALSKPS